MELVETKPNSASENNKLSPIICNKRFETVCIISPMPMPIYNLYIEVL